MIVIHIPHSSTLIPDKYRDQFILNQEDLEQEAILMADIHTDKFVERLPYKKLIFPISRLVCDVERFRNDNEEIMTQQGMGVVYTQTHDLQPLRKPVDPEPIKKELYDPHHKEFTTLVEDCLKSHDTCWILDIHSYADKPLPYELYQNESRPDICLGFDTFHIDEELVKKIQMRCKQVGSVQLNQPFRGSIVPSKFYNKEPRVKSLMIEINKRTYSDKITHIQDLIKDITAIIVHQNNVINPES